MLAARVAGVAEPEETALLSPGQRDVPITEQCPDGQGVRLLARYDRSDKARGGLGQGVVYVLDLSRRRIEG
jgi:hypothetical protein